MPNVTFDDEEFMKQIDKWDSRVRREKFISRMEHKYKAKEHHFGRR